MVLIASMDGALGFRRRKRKSYHRYQLHDVIDECITDVYKRQYNIHSIYHVNGKGGIWNYWDRNLTDWMLTNSSKGNKLIMIGKSFGAFDLAEIYKNNIGLLEYKKRAFISIDPDRIFRRGRNLYIPKMDYSCNIIQQDTLLHGCDLYEYSDSTSNKVDNIYIKHSDHFSIVNSRLVRDEIFSIIQYYSEVL